MEGYDELEAEEDMEDFGGFAVNCVTEDNGKILLEVVLFLIMPMI